MPQSLAKIYVHLAFSTKHRTPWLDLPVRERVHAYFASIVRDIGSPWVVGGGVDDHVHQDARAANLGRCWSDKESESESADGCCADTPHPRPFSPRRGEGSTIRACRCATNDSVALQTPVGRGAKRRMPRGPTAWRAAGYCVERCSLATEGTEAAEARGRGGVI